MALELALGVDRSDWTLARGLHLIGRDDRLDLSVAEHGPPILIQARKRQVNLAIEPGFLRYGVARTRVQVPWRVTAHRVLCTKCP